jgi:HK97 family phage major capsid protein
MEEIKNTLKEFFETEGKAIIKKVTEEEITKFARETLKVPEFSAGEKKDINLFFRALVDRDIATVRALSSGVDSAGGYFVPEEFVATVLDIAKDVGYVRRYGTVLKMSSDTLNIPKIDSKPNVVWIAQGEGISTGKPTIGQVQLVAKKAGLIVPVTRELFMDSKVDIQSLLGRIIGESIAEAEDDQGFTGDGTVFTGILNDANVNVVSMPATKTGFADITADDLINLISAVPSSVAGKGVFVMHRSVLAKIKTLKDGNGSYLFNPIDKTIWGYPVLTSDVMPTMSDSAVDTKFIIFGDLSYLYLGDREQISVAVADQATVGTDNLFEKNMLALRIIERVGITIAMPNAFGVLKTAAA